MSLLCADCMNIGDFTGWFGTLQVSVNPLEICKESDVCNADVVLI